MLLNVFLFLKRELVQLHVKGSTAKPMFDFSIFSIKKSSSVCKEVKKIQQNYFLILVI